MPAAAAPDPAPSLAAARRRAVSGFTLYDVANSAFVTTVVTAVGGPFLTALAEAAAGDDGRLDLLGLAPRAGAVFAYAVSLSVLLQVLALPLLGALADRPAAKRRVLVAGTWTGSAAALLLAAAPGPLVGLAAFVVANVAYGSAILVYNAYLADVAEPADRHRVSARGFAFGYAGGGFVLALALALLTAAGPLGLDRAVAVRLAIAGSALWWLALGLVAVRRLDAARLLPWAQPVDAAREPLAQQVRGSLRQLRGSLTALRRLPGTLRFLVAFLLFNDAIQAVVALSAVVLTQELFVAQGQGAEDATPFLLQLVLLIQMVAIVGATVCGRLAERIGGKRTLLLTLAIWVGVVLYAVLALETTAQAYVMGAVIALVLGGSQSVARSLFSQMVPDARQSSFFGFYELAERGTAWVGTLVFAVVLDVTGSYRGALLSLLALFAAGGLLLAATDTDAAVQAAQEADADALAARTAA
ncbi:MAG TPA: MFS transporter [Mycobacteriales bacterium]|nr:MFS transporter [Mycobacteriales bacterium]